MLPKNFLFSLRRLSKTFLVVIELLLFKVVFYSDIFSFQNKPDFLVFFFKGFAVQLTKISRTQNTDAEMIAARRELCGALRLV